MPARGAGKRVVQAAPAALHVTHNTGVSLMRIRALALAALLALGVLAPTAASADVCYDVDVVLNGDVLVDEADCLAV